MKRYSYLILMLVAAVTFSACNKWDEPEFEVPTYQGEPANKTIADIINVYTEAGHLDSICHAGETFIVRATVVSSDEGGNFYKNMVIQDETGAIQLQINQSGLCHTYPVGQTVYLNCSGLVVGNYHGVYQVGWIYKTINDLLGGAYWLNEDKYADGESPDNPYLLYDDLDNIGAHLGVGDKFGYDYAYNIFKQNIWATAKFAYSHVDFHVGANFTTTEMWRTGYMRNGRFPDNSQGRSDLKVFPDYGLKAGITYKINGRNYLVLNAQWQTQAPSILDAFINPSVRNDYVNWIESEKDLGVDFSYIMRYPYRQW